MTQRMLPRHENSRKIVQKSRVFFKQAVYSLEEKALHVDSRSEDFDDGVFFHNEK